jgi:hypothetical protein
MGTTLMSLNTCCCAANMFQGQCDTLSFLPARKCHLVDPPETPKTPKNRRKAADKYPKLSIYIYISMDAHWRAVRRDLDVTKRSRDVAIPKTRMLGPTPSIFCRVEPPKTEKQVFGDPQDIFM